MRELEGNSEDRTEQRENEMAEEAAAPNTYVATVVRDDFFNDPFFKNWWSDFDKPMATAGKAFNRQVSGRKKYKRKFILYTINITILFFFVIHTTYLDFLCSFTPMGWLVTLFFR